MGAMERFGREYYTRSLRRVEYSESEEVLDIEGKSIATAL
jgi:hypothetical protein